jgi:hypothetical protein
MDTKNTMIGDKIRLVIVAILIAAALLLLLGAGGGSGIGRYQVNLGGGTNPVILDTTTGDWKMFDINTGMVKQAGKWSSPSIPTY